MHIKTPTQKQLLYIRLILSCTILLYLISLIDIGRIKFLLPKLRKDYIWQPFFLLLLTNLTSGFRWSLVLNHFQVKQSFLDSWLYYLTAGFYSIVLPGVIGGDAVRLTLSAKSNAKSKTLIAASIIFERTCGLMVIFTLASIATILLPIPIVDNQFLLRLIIGISVGVLFLFSLFFAVLKISPSSWYKDTGTLRNWKQQTTALLVHLRSLSFGTILLILFLSLLAHIFDITGSFFLNMALNINQPFSIFLLIMPLVYVLTILPISIGGIGVREGVLTFFLVQLGIMASDAVLLAFLIYINRVLVGLIGGLIQFIDKRIVLRKKYENMS